MASAPFDLLTVDEVAELLRVNQQTVRNWIDGDQLASVRLGTRRVRVHRKALEAFIGIQPEEAGDNGQPGSEEQQAATAGPIDGDAVADALEQVAASLAALAGAVRSGQGA